MIPCPLMVYSPRMKGATAMAKIHIEGDAWRCLCGNENHLDGFGPLQRRPGIEIYQVIPTDNPPPEWKEWWNARFWGCRQCGRVIDADMGGEVVQPEGTVKF